MTNSFKPKHYIIYKISLYVIITFTAIKKYGKNTKEFIEVLKQQKLSKEHKMVSFDVKPLFTNVPLNRTIDIILKRIYEKNEIVTSVSKNEMKEMLILCTKKDHFTFESRTYVQTDGVAMSSPLGPVLADIFMIELENSLLPNLTKYITFCKRYVDYTIFFCKNRHH